MKFSDFIVKEAVVPELKATNRNEVIQELVQSLVDAGQVPESAGEEIVAAVIKREQGGSTGFGWGVAAPHVKHAKIKKMVATVGCSPEGIDFAALDNQPVFSLFLLLSPENQPQQHQSAMQVIFSSLQKPTFRKFLRQARSADMIVDLLDEADQGK